MLGGMLDDIDLPMFEPTAEQREYRVRRKEYRAAEKALPHPLDNETIFLIQFACRAMVLVALLILYVTPAFFVVLGYTNKQDGLFLGGLFGLVLAFFAHVKMYNKSRTWHPLLAYLEAGEDGEASGDTNGEKNAGE